LRKLLAARILMWTFLAAAVLPILAAVLGFFWYRNINTEPMVGFGFAMAVFLWWPVPAFASIAFLFALAWQEGLQERIRESQNGGPKDVVA
jgi:hypothetical protein